MKIEIIEMFKVRRDVFHPGEIRVVPDGDGARYCAAGWARDMSGSVGTGEKVSGENTTLEVGGMTHPSVTSNG